jgi:peptidase M23-like protein
VKLPLALLAAFLLALGFAQPVRAESWTWPLRGEVITPYRNGDDPYAAGQHRGIDIAGPVGAPVAAATAGKVTFAGTAGRSGLTVGVRTADGRYDTSYLHLSALGVREGQAVSAGDRLAAVGTTGHRSAERPHLHFGVRDAGSRHAYHDPMDFLPAPPAPGRPESPRLPVPVTVPATPEPSPVGRPVRVPAVRRAPRAAPRFRPLPAPAPRAHPLPATPAVPAFRSAAAARPARPSATPRPAVPGLGPAASAEPAPAPSPARAGARPSPAPHGRQDLGWALACAGLLLAAAFVGGTGEGRAAAGRGGARLAALLRPLAGRG